MSVIANNEKPSASTTVTVVEIPASTVNAVVNFKIHNLDTSASDVWKLWITENPLNPSDEDLFDSGNLGPGETFRDHGGYAKAGESIVFESTNGISNVRVSVLVE